MFACVAVKVVNVLQVRVNLCPDESRKSCCVYSSLSLSLNIFLVFLFLVSKPVEVKCLVSVFLNLIKWQYNVQ